MSLRLRALAPVSLTHQSNFIDVFVLLEMIEVNGVVNGSFLKNCFVLVTFYWDKVPCAT